MYTLGTFEDTMICAMMFAMGACRLHISKINIFFVQHNIYFLSSHYIILFYRLVVYPTRYDTVSSSLAVMAQTNLADCLEPSETLVSL